MTTASAELFDPQLLRALRAAPWRTLERRFLFILAASIALHFAFASYIASQPMPAAEAQLDELQDRVPQRVRLPPLLPIPKAPVHHPAARAREARPTSPAAAIDKGQRAREAVIKVLGAAGPNGAFSDLLDAPVDEIALALRGASGRLTAAPTLAGPRGPATGEVVALERLGTQGARPVALAARKDQGPATAVPGEILVDDDEIDPRVLQQFIAARRAAVQSCYERELHHNPAMKGGKVVLRLAIGPGGRVSGLAVEEDTLGSSAVSSCMSTLMKRWIFPVAPKDELPVSVPFIFARAN